MKRNRRGILGKRVFEGQRWVLADVAERIIGEMERELRSMTDKHRIAERRIAELEAQLDTESQRPKG